MTSSPRPLGFGLVGCGAISETHAAAIGLLDGCRVTAAASRDPAKAAAFTAKHGGAACRDLAELLTRSDVDAVVIGTPSGQHADQGLAAARAGRHVVVEKPIDVSLEAADRLIAGCRAAKVTLSVISQFRFLDVVRDARAALAAGRFGRLTMGSAYVRWFRPQAYYDSAAWRGTRALDGGGALINQSIHAIDQLLYCFGPVERVQAATATLAHAIEVEDVGVAALRFAHGGLGHVVGTTAAAPGQAARLDLHGTTGSLCFDLGGRVRHREFRDETGDPGTWGKTSKEIPEATIGVEGASDPKAIGVENHRRQFADIAAAIRDGRDPLVTGEEGRRALSLILAIYESARTGREAVPA